MKLKVNHLFYGYCALLIMVLAWAIFASAQTNSPAQLTPQAVADAGSADTPQDQQVAKEQFLLTFGLDRVEFLQRQLFGQPGWRYIASIIYIVLAFFAAKLIDLVFLAWLKKLVAKTKTRFIEILIDLLALPVKVIAFVILLHIGLNIFSWPAWVSIYLSKGLKLAVAISLTYVALKSIDLWLGYWRSRAVEVLDKSFNEQVYPAVSKALKVFVIIVAALVTMQNLGLNVTGLLASLSIGGLAIGLAAQDTLGNLFGALSIYFDKPFHVGERIQFENVDGVVERIGLRSTWVRNLDGHLIAVPNKTMGNATITNIARRPNIRTLMNIGLTYDTKPEKIQRALAILDEVYRTHPMTFDVIISFNKFADFSLNIFVVHWWNSTDYRAYLGGMQELNLTIKKRFDEEGISFAFPTQTLYMKQDSTWSMQGLNPAAPTEPVRQVRLQ